MDYYNQTKKYFVNLDNKTDRLQDTRRQVGDKFIRWPACQGKILTLDQLDALFDMKKCNDIYKCNQTKLQASATISQYSIYKHVAEDESLNDDDFVLICEDDNQYVKNFPEKFNQLRTVLDQERFEFVEIVILKYMVIYEQIDYCKILSLLHSNNVYDSVDILKSHGYTDKLIEVFAKYTESFRNTIRVYPQHIYSFYYTGMQSDKYSHLHTNAQHLFSVHKILPYSSSCYLIRKKTCKRIVNKYKRPWWFTDDFKQIAPIQNIMLCSPFLAFESPTSEDSSINEYATMINYLNNRLISKRFKYRFFMFKTFKVILSWHLSPSKIKRKIMRFIEKILYLS